MKILFISGLPACGKLTTATEIANLTGFKLFHNHLVVDALMAVFDFASPQFILLREQFWLDVFRAAMIERSNGIIFTFTPDYSVRKEFVETLITMVNEADGVSIDFIEIACAESIVLERIASDSRRQFKKLVDASLCAELLAQKKFHYPYLPPPAITIDSSTSMAIDSARIIIDRLGLIRL